VKIAFGIATYMRPEDLAEVLPAVAAQVADAEVAPTDAVILVIDNDPAGGARAMVEAFTHPATQVTYIHEPHPGISAARNAALDAAESSDVLIFIDDDERPMAGWLTALLGVYRGGTAKAVVGAVVSEYEIPPEPWILDGGFFTRRRLTTGTRVDVAATNNLLLDMAFVRSIGLRFDEEFGIAGGGDTMFTRTLDRKGGTMLWCDEAVVIDVVPASRITREWVTMRAFRSGNSWSRTSVRLEGGAWSRFVVRLGLSARGLGRLVAGAGLWLIGVLGGGQRRRARAVKAMARGGGMLLGAWGYTYRQYKRTKA
jgi:glycosyltransferase involved in cell wall biosynthesis